MALESSEMESGTAVSCPKAQNVSFLFLLTRRNFQILLKGETTQM